MTPVTEGKSLYTGPRADVLDLDQDTMMTRASADNILTQLQLTELSGDSSDSSNSSNSSSSSSFARSSRRSRSHKPPRNPCGPKCSSDRDHRAHKREPSPPPSPGTIRNHTLLYGALATCATVGATNTFYQVAKARRLRNKDMSEREMCAEEEKRMRQSGILWDAFGVACMAIGVNNVRLGWNRYNGWRKQQAELYGKH